MQALAIHAHWRGAETGSLGLVASVVYVRNGPIVQPASHLNLVTKPISSLSSGEKRGMVTEHKKLS